MLLLPEEYMKRCPWGSDELLMQYHDEEWGEPVHGDQRLYEFLVLDGMQAGLSWITILRKREAFRKAFDGFDLQKVANYDDKKIEELMNNKEIVRNRAKIMGAITNARCVLKLQQEGVSFDSFLWNFVGGETIHNNPRTFKDIPTVTNESKAMSDALRERGFKFVGPTICYAFMQAVGMVNDHLVECYRYDELASRE